MSLLKEIISSAVSAIFSIDFYVIFQAWCSQDVPPGQILCNLLRFVLHLVFFFSERPF